MGVGSLGGEGGVGCAQTDRSRRWATDDDGDGSEKRDRGVGGGDGGGGPKTDSVVLRVWCGGVGTLVVVKCDKTFNKTRPERWVGTSVPRRGGVRGLGERESGPLGEGEVPHRLLREREPKPRNFEHQNTCG